jgi:hypothetical protein
MNNAKAKFIIMLSFVSLVFGSYFAFYSYQNRQTYQSNAGDNEMSQDHDTNPSDNEMSQDHDTNPSDNEMSQDHDTNPSDHDTALPDSDNKDNDFADNDRDTGPNPTPLPTARPTARPTATPTKIPTSTPIPSVTPIPTQAGCPLKSQGDANCDGVVDQTDYFYYVLVVNGGTLPAGVSCDFNGDGEVGVKDRDIILQTLNGQ